MSDYVAQQHKSQRPPPASLGINVVKPKFPQYAMMSRRIESFESWPEYLPVAVKDLVEAGLVYTGVGDSVRCYHCGGGLRNWEPEDDPMKEHAKWYPSCPHIKLLKGQSYIERVQNGEPVERDGLDSGKFVATSHVPDTADLIDTPAARSCIDMGYSADVVKKAISVYQKRRGNTDFKGIDLCGIIFDMEEHPENFENDNVTDGACSADASIDATTAVDTEEIESIDELMEENERLKNDSMCKICLDNRADVIFLPCGHMVTCPQCAPAMTKCPICRKIINGQIKAFFATVKH